MTDKQRVEAIRTGKTALGIEFGSTRIKATLIDHEGNQLSGGTHEWKSTFEEGVWTYALEDAISGLQSCYGKLKASVQQTYGLELSEVGSIGISGMMHGYLAFDAFDKQLYPFVTWRNTITETESDLLGELFDYPIPQRWSVAHLYRALRSGEKHLEELDRITTLAGYIHYMLTGEHVLGIGEASGMFPVDGQKVCYQQKLLERFDSIIAEHGYDFTLTQLLPEIRPAGEFAGGLTEEGSLLIDPSGTLHSGIPCAPPEGDAATGMVATGCVRAGSGNVSAGTSIFSMLVLSEPLSKRYPSVDVVATPDGLPVAMVHSTNGFGDLDGWFSLFSQVADGLGFPADDLYGKLLPLAFKEEGSAELPAVCSYLAGEHLTGFSEGRPLLVRNPSTPFRLGGLIRALLYSAFCALSEGVSLLCEKEGIEIEELKAHGGIFGTPKVALKALSSALGVPVSTSSTAAEGGSYGMALLAAYCQRDHRDLSLSDYLHGVLSTDGDERYVPTEEDRKDFLDYFKRYQRVLEVERTAVEKL